MKNILFITPYPFDEAPSQRFRFEQYFRFLKEENINYTQKSFLSYKTWYILYKPGHQFQKISGILSGFAKRLGLLFTLWKYDLVFIHREASPIGPPIFEFIVTNIFRKKVNYDFDDAIWLPNTSEMNKIVAKIKWHSKVKHICRWATSVTCGNAYLADFAKQYNTNVIYLPTTIDTELGHNQLRTFKHNEKIVIGWTGTFSTIHYLDAIIPIIAQLEKEFDFEFRVISNKNPEFALKSFRYIPWNKSTEIEDLIQFDIGLMPLFDDQWAKGKCGFKALQYMALGIITVASPVGVNTTIIEQGIDGFLCENNNQREQTLRQLLQNPDLKTISQKSRDKVQRFYSVNSQKEKFLSVIKA